MFVKTALEKRTDEIGKVSQNQLVVAKKLTFIQEGEGGGGKEGGCEER